MPENTFAYQHRDVMNQSTGRTKQERYADLVRERREYDPSPWELVNPSQVADGEYDVPHMGPWTGWAHDLDADLMVVGQDWRDVEYFVTNRGCDNPRNPTNAALQKLLLSIGRPIPAPPSHGGPGDSTVEREEASRATCGVWLTNALLWLKTGGLSAKVDSAWFGEPSMLLLKAQVDLVQPRVIVALGEQAYDCLLKAYGLPPRRGPFKDAVERNTGVEFALGGQAVMILAVYHCGARIQNTLRPLDRQLQDWERVQAALRA